MSSRTKNIIKYEDLETIKKLIEYYTEKRNFLDVRNCGRKSNNELIKLSKRIIDKIEKDDEPLSGIQDEYIDFIYDIENAFGINIFPIKSIYRQYLDKNIETFFLIKLLASSYLSTRDYSVFILLNKFSEGFSKPTLHKIGDSLKISRERVRQIINNGIQNFNKSFINLINENDSYRLFFKKYFTEHKDILVIDDVFADNINKTENCDFSKSYIGYILALFLSKDYFNFCIDSNSTKNNEYLIKKDLESAINLKELFKKLSIKIKTLRTLKIDAEIIVRQNASDCNEESIQKLIKIFEVIVREEYNIPYDENLRMFYYAR
ncbi:MAG: sigma factor-like helix-turn-helix DNA-binding protein [Bacteroidales bacterium]|nr:hypothetical protein [Bacteroidales bacterium]MDD4214906.1 sigma factor-like helix-turn-helix DNA-binding protein [Bacteroidales bacterium]